MLKLCLQLHNSAPQARGTVLNYARIWAITGLLAIPLASAAMAAQSGCQLNSPKGAIQHVIQIQFDNVHFTRDNPNVPSDLEQMPHLLNFLKNSGVLLSNHHTAVISRTATDILTTLTGVYGDRHGVPVSNSFRYFQPNGTSSTLGVLRSRGGIAG